jgi:hypothetical protein
MLETIHQEIDNLPTEAQELLLDFIDILKKRYTSAKTSQQPISNNLPPATHRRHKGTAKGKLIIHTDDKEHLKDFQQYI